MDLGKLGSLHHLPESGAVDPRQLRETEKGQTLGVILPGRNAARNDGTDPRTWFRQIISDELERASIGGETFAETLHYLLRNDRNANCPNPDCERTVEISQPGMRGSCVCGEIVLPSDGLRIHEQFDEHTSAIQCHHRVMDTLETVALINSLRYLVGSGKGRKAIINTAFVMDGQLAIFGTIAVLARAVKTELRRIQELISEERQEQTKRMLDARSKLFISRQLRMTSQALAAAVTDEPVMGGRAWTTLLCDDERVKSALAIWLNSTLGNLLRTCYAQITHQGAPRCK